MLKIPISTPGEFINMKWLSKNYWWWGNYYTMDAAVATVCDHKHSVSLLESEKEADTAPARGQDGAPGRGTGMNLTTPSSPCPPWKPREGLPHWGVCRHLLEGVEFLFIISMCTFFLNLKPFCSLASWYSYPQEQPGQEINSTILPRNQNVAS